MAKLLKISLSHDASPKPYDIKRFEELFQLHYLNHLEIADWRTEQWLKKKCARAHKKGKIGELALWLGRLHGRSIEEALIPDISIRWIDDTIGYGLFADKVIQQWEFIGEYTGLLRQRNLFSPNVNDYCFMYPRAWVSCRAFTIDSKAHGNFTRFINHSDEPNLESVSVYHGGMFHIIFRAIQAIPAHSELTYDYGDMYWRSRKKL